MSNNVLIRKEKIKIKTSDQQLALRLRKQLNDTLQFDFVVMMEKVFAQGVPSDLYINIDKLELDLGAVSAQDFEQHFIRLAETRLINELRKQLFDNGETLYPGKRKEDNFRYDTNADSSASSQYILGKQQELNALFYFLQNGIYPWWYKKEQQQTPGKIIENLSEQETETLLIRIFSLKKSCPLEELQTIIRRFLIHLPRSKNEAIIYRLLALYNSQMLTANIEILIKNKDELQQLFSISEKEFYTQVFQFLITENNETEDNIIYIFLQHLKKFKNFLLPGLKDKIGKTAGGYDSSFAAALKQELINQSEEIESAATDNQTIDAELKKNNLDLLKKKIQNKQIHTQAEEEGIYISNAGLILLHPFLITFFKGEGLLNTENKFISIDAQHKAAVLLYYMQCGNEQYEEWEMPLNKIICGIASNEIINDGILITEKEKEECNHLLQTMISYWDALKGASIEAVQTTFILREGKIKWKEDYWLMQVERTGVDILIDRLPWGFSTIKFPWLDCIIYTEW